MTEQEFAEQQENMLSELPQEFHGAIAAIAWDNWHPYGYTEVLSYLDDLIRGLEPSIQNYRERIEKEYEAENYGH